MAEVELMIAEAPGKAEHKRSVYIVDDDRDIRKSLHFLLASQSVTVWPFAAARDFVDQLPDLKPGPILLDIRMADIDGLQLLEMLKERMVSWPVIVITAHGDVATAVRAMKLGAIEFIEKPFGPYLLDHALTQAFAILDKAQQSQRACEDARRLLDLLSPREREILDILMEGVRNKIAAHRLGLSVRTIEMHRSNAFSKLKVRSIAEVMVLAATAGNDPHTGV